MEFTVNQIISNRKKEIFNKVQDMEQQKLELQLQIKELQSQINGVQYNIELLIAEANMLDAVTERGMLINTEQSARKRGHDRITFEDAVKEIFREAGGPMKFEDVVAKLEKYGYTYTKNTVYAKVRNTPFIESAGKHGYYQLLHGRF